VRIDLSGNKFTFPQQCACCGESPETTLSASASKSTGKRVVHTTSKSWEFPYCTRCASHVRAAREAVTAITIIAIVSVIVALYLHFGVDQSGIGLFVALAGIGTAIYLHQVLMAKAKAMCSASCVTVKSAVGYVGWQGTCHMFEVLSSQYALAFMVANQSKLVNVSPQVWQWLQDNGYGSPRGNLPQSAKRFMK